MFDSFEAQETEEIKHLLNLTENTDLAVIPGGLTSLLQPLGICKQHRRSLEVGCPKHPGASTIGSQLQDGDCTDGWQNLTTQP